MVTLVLQLCEYLKLADLLDHKRITGLFNWLVWVTCFVPVKDEMLTDIVGAGSILLSLMV